ncbi:unnamed protein product, partial [Phaeothamnion confervicola]
DLLEQVKGTNKDFELSPLLKTLTVELLSHHVPTRMAALCWINMLLEKSPQEMGQFLEELLPALLKTLSDDSDEASRCIFPSRSGEFAFMLARISLNESEFNRVLNAVLQLFSAERRLLETRGSLIIRKLCVLLNAKSIYTALAEVLQAKQQQHDLAFVSIMVQQSLNLILLTAAELEELRTALKMSFQPEASPEDRELFVALFSCWCHNPVSTFSLCILAQAYELSSQLIKEFSEVEITVAFLMQVDKLVQLLESPIFLNLRLQLLDVDAPHYAHLVKSLYGLLMLLPQSTAFRTLRDRSASRWQSG